MTKILVIEDEPPVRANILELLEAEDFDAVSAENGFIGVLWAQQHLPDLIISDVMMPEINGYEVLEALRQEPRTATIPFIFLTAMADKSDIRQGMQLGADDYLTKPFTRAELLSAIASRLEKQAAILQQYNSEHQRAEALQQKVKELQQNATSTDLQLDALNVISKLNVAIQMLQKVQPGMRRDHCIEILQQVCNEEISLLNQMPNLQDLLTSENAQLLRQFNLIS